LPRCRVDAEAGESVTMVLSLAHIDSGQRIAW
jgi:hypothetical protein